MPATLVKKGLMVLRSRAHKERMRKVGNRRASSGSVVYFIYLCPWLFLAFTFASQSPVSMTTGFFICEGGSWLKLCVFIQPTFKKGTLSHRHCAMWPFRSPLILWFSKSVTRSLRCWAARCCLCKAHNRIPPHTIWFSRIKWLSSERAVNIRTYPLYAYYQYTQISLQRAQGLEVNKETNSCEAATDLVFRMTEFWLILWFIFLLSLGVLEISNKWLPQFYSQIFSRHEFCSQI